ncbi:MAG: hypothetical protein WAV07_08865 [Candidatus Contendobacter sp.]
MNSLPISPEFDRLVGQTLALAELYRALGIAPPLAPGEEITWVGLDARTETGINALLACYDPEREGEPFDVTLAVYETVQQRDPAGRDRGTARQRRAVLELVREVGSPDRLRVTAADAPESDRERPLVEVLRELRAALEAWPGERANRLAPRTSDPEP